MALEWTHKRYFQSWGGLNDDSSLVNADKSDGPVQFKSTSAEDVHTMLTFPSVWNTGNPTKSYALADDNKTLVVTYVFADGTKEAEFVTAINAAYDDGSAFPEQFITHIKTEWFSSAGVTRTENNIITDSDFE